MYTSRDSSSDPCMYAVAFERPGRRLRDDFFPVASLYVGKCFV